MDAIEQGVHRFKASKEDLNCVHFIGKGTYGLSTLWIANCKPLKKYVMLRKTELDLLEYRDLENLQYEMHLSSQLQHPNILPFQCSFVQEREIWTAFPFFDYGSCADIIQAGFPNGLNEMAITYILRNVLKALEYIHRVGYIHRAVKGCHILVSSDGRVCLTGLRYCIPMWNEEHRRSAVHSFPDHAVAILPWIAPEVLDQNLIGYSEKSDIYSVGITSIELSTGKIPFSDMPATQIFLEKISGQLPPPLDFDIIKERTSSECARSSSELETCDQTNQQSSSRSPARSRASPSPQLSRKFSFTFQHVIESCLDRNASQRPSATSLLGSSFFKQAKKKNREISSMSQMLSPVTPIADVSSFQEEDFEKRLPTDASLDIERLNLEEEWSF